MTCDESSAPDQRPDMPRPDVPRPADAPPTSADPSAERPQGAPAEWPADPPLGSPPESPPVGIESLVREHYAAVYQYAYRLTGSAADAEDVTQQTYLLAQRHLAQLRHPDRVRSWLLAITRSSWSKSRRRGAPRPAVDLELDVNTIPDATAAEEPIDREQLQRVLDELPDEFRTVVLMYYFEQLTYREIATALDVPPGTVMSRLSRAKTSLRARLFRAAGVRTSLRGPHCEPQPAAAGPGAALRRE
jgi:RNA polymerase sigma-70 factor (ECF subfamily)